MMNLWELLKVSKGLPPSDLETFLTAEKIGSKNSGSSTTTSIAKGYPCVLENSVGLPAVGYKIYGNSIQDGEPSPESPVEIQSVGELVTQGEYAGKYKIPVVTSSENHELVTTNIYLDEPLRKIGDYADVIDFKRGIVERNISRFDFTGDENIYSQHIDINLFSFNMTGYLRIKKITLLSSHYQSQVNANSYGEVLDMHCAFYANMTASGKLMYIRNSNFNTVSDFKAYLQEQYNAGTPVTMYYALDEANEESISLPSIPTFNGTTILSVGTEIHPSNMEITYKSGGKNYD